MADRRFRFKNFPQDGNLWWIRWVDRYRVPQGRSHAPSVDVLLSRIPPEIRSASEADPDRLRRQTVDWGVCQILSGAIPALQIGSVFRNGEHFGDLPVLPRSFHFTKGLTEEVVCPIGTEWTPKPANWSKPYRILNRSEYPLSDLQQENSTSPINFLDSQCVALRQRGLTLVIPCHEVFRALYAPHQLLVEALLKGPWEQNIKDVVKEKDTCVRKDGTWQIVLDKFIPDEFALWIANLLFDDSGRRAARAVYTHMMRTHPGIMHAGLPFKWETLDLQANCWELRRNPDKYLAVELTAISWPNQGIEVVLERENSGLRGKEHTPVDKEAPFSGVKNAADFSSESIDVYSDDDPERDSTSVTFISRRPEWINAPEVKKFERDTSHSYEKEGRKVAGDEILKDASPGIDVGAKTDLAKTEFLGRHETSARLVEIADMLDLLVSENAISAWTAVPCFSNPKKIGDLVVWPLPNRLPNMNRVISTRWSFLDKKFQRRRCALVAEVHVESGTVYWLEVECGVNSLKSLLFTVGDLGVRVQVVVANLLTACVQQRGIWAADKSLTPKSGAAATLPWQHSYIKSTRRINHRRALAAILKLRGTKPTPRRSV